MRLFDKTGIRKGTPDEKEVPGSIEHSCPAPSGMRTPIAESIRRMESLEVRFYPWEKKYAGMDVSEPHQLKQLDDENRGLKRFIADLALDKPKLLGSLF